MLGPLVLTVLGALAVFVPVMAKRGNLPDAVPALLLVAGAVWGFWAWRRRRSKKRFAGAAVQAAVALGLGYYLFLFSAYDDAKAPAVGSPAPEFRAERVRDGATFDLRAERGSQLLLVFFRGEW